MRKNAVLLITILLLGHGYYLLTGDFRLGNILTETSSQVSLTPLAQNKLRDVRTILDQPYTYLGHGNQSYAFSSQDGTYVLKLFMNEYLERTWVKHLLPPIPPFRQFMLHRGEDRTYRLNRLLNGYALSYAYDRENSGLVYFHLNQEEPVGDVTLIDGLGIKRTIPLNSYVFAVQKKVIITKQEFHNLLSKGDVEGVKKRITQLLALYHEQYKKGLFDHDHNLIDNTGFIGDQVVRQDVGKVVMNHRMTDPEAMQKDLDKIINTRLIPWFSEHYPQYSEELAVWIRDYGNKLNSPKVISPPK